MGFVTCSQTFEWGYKPNPAKSGNQVALYTHASNFVLQDKSCTPPSANMVCLKILTIVRYHYFSVVAEIFGAVDGTWPQNQYVVTIKGGKQHASLYWKVLLWHKEIK